MADGAAPVQASQAAIWTSLPVQPARLCLPYTPTQQRHTLCSGAHKHANHVANLLLILLCLMSIAAQLHVGGQLRGQTQRIRVVKSRASNVLNNKWRREART